MADFKVSAERVEIFPHPSADRLELAKVGMYCLVVQKGAYEDGDIVVFAPKRSILPESIRGNYQNEETGQSYLKNGTTVKSVRLRGELSEGVVLDKDWVCDHINRGYMHPVLLAGMIGEDLSEELGIFEEEIPAPRVSGGPNGMKFSSRPSNMRSPIFSRHDCENIRLHQREFQEGEPVVVSEKVHGTQINIIMYEDGMIEVGSKGLLKRGIVLEEQDGNIYWEALRNSGLIEIKNEFWPDRFVQFMGEVIPAQKGFSYGKTNPEIALFRVEVDRVRYNPINMPRDAWMKLSSHWVPWIAASFCMEEIVKMSKGMESVSGKALHIKEGVVVEPSAPRLAERGSWPLIVKVINPKYKGDDDDIS